MSESSLANQLVRAEREILVRALQGNSHSAAATALYLGISTAKCRRLCKKHELDVDQMRLRRMVELLGELAS